jgi:predicted porin
LDGYAANSSDLYDIGTRGAYSQAANRQTFVELEGGFGRVRAGFMRTHGYELATFSGHTFTGEGAVGGQVAHGFGLGAAGGTRSNSIEYQLPKMGAMNIAIQMGSTGGRESTEFGVAGSSAGNTATGRGTTKDARTSLQVKYEAGALKAGITYTNYSSVASAIAQNCSTTSTTGSNAYCAYGALGQLTSISTAAAGNFTGDAEYNTNLTQLGGSYDFGMIKVGATYNTGAFNRTSVTTSAAGTPPSVASGSGVASYDIRSQAISFSMPLGAATLYGGMGTASQATGSSSIHDFSTQQIALDYAFSKRTKVYGLIGAAKDQARINANAATSAYMTQTGVGVLTTF